MRTWILTVAVLVGACDGTGVPDHGGRTMETITCGGALVGTPWQASYSMSRFENGDVFATATVMAADGEKTDSVTLAPDQDSRATVGFIYDTYGVPSGGSWVFELYRNPTGVAVEYIDHEVPGGTLGWVWQYDACHSQTF